MRSCVLIALALATSVAALSATNKDTSNVSTNEDASYVTVFSLYNLNGYYMEFSDYIANLGIIEMNNIINSACVTGIWLFYTTHDYNTDTIGSVTWMWGLDYCYNFTEEFTNTISSLKYAGSQDFLNDDTFTLYDHPFFEGMEYFGKSDVNTDVGYMNDLASSIIITGRSPWTFFEDEGYSGVSVCVYPNTNFTDIYVSFLTNTKEIGLKANTISSVAKGCHSDNIVQAPPNQILNMGETGAMGVFEKELYEPLY